MGDGGGVVRVTNVKICHRVGGKGSIIVCEKCYNEIEGSVSEFYAASKAYDIGIDPRYNYCPWCSAPLKEEDDG